MKTKKRPRSDTSKISRYRFATMLVLVFVLIGGFLLIERKIQLYYKSSEAAPNSTISFTPASATVGSGQSFNLAARINPGTNQITAVELHITFDATKFNLTGVTVDSGTWNTLQTTQIDNTNGTATVIVGVPTHSPPVYITTTTTVATFAFTVKTTSTGSTSSIGFAATTKAAAAGESANVITSMTGDTITIDTTPPTLAQVTAVPTPSKNTTPSYTFSSTEAGTITYGGDCSSSTTAATSGNNTITFNTLSAGTHSNCTIKVTDAAGNQSTALSVNSFTIDNVLPVVTQVTAVPTPTKNTTPSYTFNTTKAGTITYGGDCSSSTTAATSGNNTITFNTLSAATHSNCTIKVTDSLGNQSTALSVNSFTIDTTAPTVTQVTAVTSPTNDTTPDYTFNTTEAGTINYGGDCSSSTTAATSGHNTITFNTLSAGTHSNCTIKVTDAAGNQSTALSVNSFTIDTTAPTLSGASPSGTLAYTATQTTLSLTTSENATCKYATSANTSYSAMTNTFSTTGSTSHSTVVTGLTKGTAYNYYVRCQDTAGNATSSDYPISFSVANTLPGDLNADGVVDIFDYSTFVTNFGSTTCGNVADIDGNCSVDIFDYNTLISNFGKTSS